MQRWFKAGCFEAIVHDSRMLLRLTDGRAPHPSAAILDSRTLQSTPTSGARAGYDGAKRKKGSKVHLAVDTLGNLLALPVTPANEQDRDQVGQLAEAIQDVSMALPSKWPSSPKPSGVSFCYHVAGWLNAASVKPPAFAVCPAITNGCPKPWPDCTIWPLSASCCPTCQMP